MWSPTLVASPLTMGSTNYLLSPKPGEKRHLFTNKSRKPVGSPYIIEFSKPLELNLTHGSMDFNMTHHLIDMGKYRSKMPFQVPPLKMPPMGGGFFGAKCKISGRDSDINLCETLTNAFHASVNNTSNKKEPFFTKVEGFQSCGIDDKYPKNILAILLSQDRPHSTNPNISFCSPAPLMKEISEPVILKDVSMPDVEKQTKTGHVSAPESEIIDTGSPSDDQGKPPVKKAKMSICTSSKRKRGRRKKKRKKRTLSDSEGSSPGFDPVQSGSEIVDEVDCGIVLTNRFAPLVNEANYDMCEVEPPEEAPLLNMLNQMHLDDFEIEFEGGGGAAGPTTELCDIHSYKADSSSSDTHTCNSSVAFILSGNDDIMTSDSEDGSFVSDVEDFQWQSFKADFEFYQEQISLEEILVGSCDSPTFKIEASLEVLDDDDNFFLNELELQTDCDSLDRLREVNRMWNQTMMECESEKMKSVKVCFAPDNCLTVVYSIPSGPEEREARKGSWDQCYLDRCRFQNRIKELEPLLAPCLTPQHRKSVYQRLFHNEEVSD